MAWERSLRLGVTAVALVVLARCDTADLQRDFVDAAEAPPGGFTRTDQNGGVVDADEDDWRTSPIYVGRITVEPAYPNPVTSGLVTIPFRILQFDEVSRGVYVRAFDADGSLIPLGETVDTSGPGLYTVTINPVQLGTAELHRVFLMDAFGELISYGDIDVR